MMLYTALALVAVCGISEAVVCKTNLDCDATTECCYIEPEFMVVSKRQSLFPQLHKPRDTGVCEKYHVMGASCWPLETANGHCGCGKDMSCQWVPEPTTTSSPIIKRMLPYHDGPGAYKCAMRQQVASK